MSGLGCRTGEEIFENINTISLITDTHILTAAHCLEPFRKEDILVRLGEYDFTQTGETGDETFNVAAMISAVSYATTGYTCAASYPAGPAAEGHRAQPH